LLLVNLPFLTSLEERFTCGELDCFLETNNDELNALEGKDFVDKATGD